MLVQMGSSIVLNEEFEEKCGDKNLFSSRDMDKISVIQALPFQVDFSLPVYKVTCGDAFCALLTAQG